MNENKFHRIKLYVGITYFNTAKYLNKFLHNNKTKIMIKILKKLFRRNFSSRKALFSELTDTSLGLRFPYRKGYQFCEVFSNVNSIYICGCDHIEDITTYLGQNLELRPNARVESSDTTGRALKSFASENTKYTRSDFE